MDDVRGHFLGLPHGTTPAAVTTNKNIKMSSFKSSENIQKKKALMIILSNLHKSLCCGCSFGSHRQGDSNEHPKQRVL